MDIRTAKGKDAVTGEGLHIFLGSFLALDVLVLRVTVLCSGVVFAS